MRSLHEDLRRENEVEASSERGFGLTVGGILLAIALWWTIVVGFGWLEFVIGMVGLSLLTFGACAPRRLSPLNAAWSRLGLLLSKVVSPIVLGIIFVTTIVPIGLLMRARGKDLLRLRREPQLDSYWIAKHPPGPAPETITRQF